jgi:hypothetical protein
MNKFRQQYIELKNDYEQLVQKFELTKKILSLELIKKEEVIDRKETYCHVCDINLSCPRNLNLHLQSYRHIENVKSYCENQ